MGLKIGDGIIENCVPGMNECAVDEPLRPKDEAGAVFWVILSAHRYINFPSAEEELQVWKGRLQFGAGRNKLEFAAVEGHPKSI